ncbi:hypothetical protein EN829_008785 [Mesorhizobium sp. M00.F.Ca.ET.186.01.1.1]|nr:hypothetical protein EN848_04345 [bacterium M00.F.Ca.ET.205.01.1.1]TGU53328.1 hypothetical protein EN795_08760 [bacterium M00.F.Ca.ET.152.01.1.1]TGV36840.1 hypothetical protein EN829_008785 [Mesorhizobium sp. M00.F.Ca.ET.186.01.1.1]TGZ41743.1 hypothetical protein EN805_19665 [bacterium M00.F.Ca.ET.162.01.1.1]
MATESTRDNKQVPEAEARRDFLKRAGRFAAVTPPAITLLLGTSLNSEAVAKSGGTRPGKGSGDNNHVHVGPSPKPFKFGESQSVRQGGGDNYGGGAHGGSRSGDPN